MDEVQYEAHAYDVDALACPCGGRFRWVSTITDRRSIERFLRHLGEPVAIDAVETTIAYDCEPPPPDE